MVTLGVICTTLSASNPPRVSASSSTGSYYFAGIALLTLALVVSGFMGLEQDRVYGKYGRDHWQEATFYLHFLALPGFGFVWQDLLSQVRTVNASAQTDINVGMQRIAIPSFYFPLVLNMITQLVCVSGVNRLTTRVSSLTVTLVLVVRKAVSLAISVLWLGKGSGSEGGLLWTGGMLVLVGTIGYATGSGRKRTEKAN